MQREHPLEVGHSDGKRRLDFLDILLSAKDEQGRGLDRQEIQDEVDTFTFEGHDTTASALAWGIYALGQYPDIQEKVYEDAKSVVGSKKHVDPGDLHAFKYIPIYIKEVLRYYTPVPVISRKSPNTIVLDGLEIPPGSRVDVPIYIMHHNPAIWKNPEDFRPERFSDKQKVEHEVFGFAPFSAGSRNCIGQVFALNELKISLAKFVNRFEVRPDPGHKPDMLWDMITRSTTGLKVCLKERSNRRQC
ncbi:cytochrome P450 4A2-like [Mya arenaria]|uniref:cytochrome P450 4A2-like n=1 Tax=Mya arenaria TaxID=6604 RepID=UPI0022E04BD5|nr:cytochrome P450 4A2-like [Mya arenaria]